MIHHYTEKETLLDIKDVTKEYNGNIVLKGVNATIKDIVEEGNCRGQVVGFIGPSGIGKSTLFRIMAGLEQPTSGNVTIGPNAIPVKAGMVGVVAQSYPLFNHRTVMGNLVEAAYKAHEKGLSKKDITAKLSAYLTDFDLLDRMDVYPAQLSGGQRQRCAILQQILARTNGMVLLMDEPFSGLDPIAKKKTQRLIRKIADLDELNTIIVVTHDVAAATAVADHIWIMGRDSDAQGKKIPGASIRQAVNLIDLGLAWEEGIEGSASFNKFVNDLSNGFAVL